MKKTISLLLVLCLMLCSCGSETSDEPIEKATEYTPISETELAADISVDSQGEMLAEASTEAFTETLAIPSTEAPQENDDGYIRVNETVYTTTDVNVRTGPGTEYDKVGRILKGQSVNRIGIGDDGWSKVIYEGTTCFMSSSYLTTNSPTETTTSTPTEAPQKTDDGYSSVNETVYATTDVNVRSGPGTEYEKVGRITQGDSVNRVGVGNNGWSKVIYDGKTCYISSKYLSASKPSETSQQESNTVMVWIPQSGSKYHSKSSCSKMKNPSQISEETAISRGYTPCSKCY